MIVLSQHPEDPGRQVFVPLRYDRQRGRWVAIRRRGRPVAFNNEREALACVLEDVLEEWCGILHRSRVVRIVSEHSEGIDADVETIRAEAGLLAQLTDRFDETMQHLLSRPDDRHRVEVDIANLVVPDEPADDQAADQADES